MLVAVPGHPPPPPPLPRASAHRSILPVSFVAGSQGQQQLRHGRTMPGDGAGQPTAKRNADSAELGEAEERPAERLRMEPPSDRPEMFNGAGINSDSGSTLERKRGSDSTEHEADARNPKQLRVGAPAPADQDAGTAAAAAVAEDPPKVRRAMQLQLHHALPAALHSDR